MWIYACERDICASDASLASETVLKHPGPEGEEGKGRLVYKAISSHLAA